MKRLPRLLAVLFGLAGLLIAVSMLTGSRSSSRPAPAPGEPDGEPNVLPGAPEVQAMGTAYPERIDRVEARDGEWALLMDETWYYWADGRLLPEDLRVDAASYVPIRFYRYRLGPVQERVVDVELQEILESRTTEQSSGSMDTRRRFNDFLDTLYQIESQFDAEHLVKRIEFLGFATRVHPLLVEPLERVERIIRVLAPHDRDVADFVAELSAVHGYNWRTIAGTMRRSYHSYGVAVDLVPRSYEGRWPYWLWAAEGGIERWWELPLASRWHIPQPVVDAFEENGFVWGGKWLFFDNLHFEYRPESILTAGSAPGS